MKQYVFQFWVNAGVVKKKKVDNVSRLVHVGHCSSLAAQEREGVRQRERERECFNAKLTLLFPDTVQKLLHGESLLN